MLLAIDSSSGIGAAVVAPDGEVLSRSVVADTRSHAEVVGVVVREVLERSGVRPHDVTAVASGTGPGPFTGLRVGMAAARAFALARRVPLLPVVSHDAIAAALLTEQGAGPVTVRTDARRREVATSRYDGFDAHRLPRRVAGPDLVAADGGAFSPAVDPGVLGALAIRALAAGRGADGGPLYLRAPDVTPSAGPKRVVQ